MEFTISNKDGMGMFYTEHDCCVPVQYVDSMASVGMRFFLDGKKISASKVKELFSDAVKSYESKKLSMTTEKSTYITKIVPKEEPKSEPVPEVAPEVPSNSTVDLSNLPFPLTSRTIVCMNTGKVYRNQSEAGKDLKLDPSYISDCIKYNKACRGYILKKAVDIQ